MRIPIKDIKLSPYQVRDLEQDPDLAALAESIKEHGQLQPIKVRFTMPVEACELHGFDGLWAPGFDKYVGDSFDCEGCMEILAAIEESEGSPYECVFGHRRLKATELAGFDEVEAIVADATDEEAQIQVLIENTQRKDLEPIEFANGLNSLQKKTRWSNREIGRKLGIPEAKVREYLDLLKEPADVQEMISARGAREPLSLRHVREARVVVSEGEPRADILRKAAKESLTIEQTRKLAERYRDAGTPEEKKRVLKVPAKKQEDEEVIDKYLEEDRKKFQEAMQRQQQEPMTVTDYIFRLQTTTERIEKFLTAGREVEVWYEESWPIIRGLLEGMADNVRSFIQEAENARG